MEHEAASFSRKLQLTEDDLARAEGIIHLSLSCSHV
jgi:hypothetical protein